jgi:hypothetical protein
MSALETAQEAVRQLTRGELAVFRAWFTEFDEQEWDREMEEDVAAGRLNGLLEEALQEFREGRTTEL